MDKNKDQHIDQVGNGENLFHDENLPPIWDDIAQELDAVEGMDIPMEDVVDLDDTIDGGHADFSVIKDGFVQTFQDKAPPKFAWDQIEQELESLSPNIDDPSDFSLIKAGFEQNYKESSLPLLSWEDLAEEMDNPTPKTPKEDYSFVKSGFEKQYSGVVLPLFSWDDLAERMDNEAVLNDTADRYSVIKDSFQQKYEKKVPPAYMWNNIQTALQKETLWGRVAYQFGNLLNSKVFSSSMLLMGAAGLLILNSRSCMLDQNITTAPIATATSYDGTPSSSFDMYDVMNGFYSHSMKKRLEDITSNRSVLLDEEEGSAQLLSDLFELEKEARKTGGTQSASTGATQVSNDLDGDHTVAISNATSNDTPQKSASNNTTDDNSAVSTLVEEAGTIDNNITTANTKASYKYNAKGLNSDGQAPSLSADKIASEDWTQKQLFSTENTTTWANQPSIDAFLAKDGLPLIEHKHVDDYAVPAMEDAAFTYHMQSMKRKKLRFEIGLSTRIGTSMFLGKTNDRAFSSESLTSTDLRLTRAFGVQLNTFFTVNDALVIGINPYSVASQHFYEFANDGSYRKTSLELSSVDFSVGYQRVLFRYGNVERLPSKFYARLDLGLGYITKSELCLGEEAMALENWHKQINWSAGLTLGTTHELKRFILDYGVTANIGLNEVINNVSTPVIAVESARLLNVGAYIGLRYTLFAKLKVAKRQRQFDWSPPFYVEEPPY